MLIDRNQSLLLIVDIQERLAPAIHDGETAVANNGRLLAAAERLGVPVFVSEQYVRGLGPTVPALQPLPADAWRFDKMHFSCTREPGFLDRLAASGRRQILVTGMETHVCVFQTTRDLVAQGYDVHVCADAVSSRTEEHRVRGLELARQAGAVVTTAETAIFDLLHQAATPEFKAVSPWVK